MNTSNKISKLIRRLYLLTMQAQALTPIKQPVQPISQLSPSAYNSPYR